MTVTKMSGMCDIVCDCSVWWWYFVGDIMATLYLDNQMVGQTGWKPCNQRCWDQRFSLELERVSSR